MTTAPPSSRYGFSISTSTSASHLPLSLSLSLSCSPLLPDLLLLPLPPKEDGNFDAHQQRALRYSWFSLKAKPFLDRSDYFRLSCKSFHLLRELHLASRVVSSSRRRSRSCLRFNTKADHRSDIPAASNTKSVEIREPPPLHAFGSAASMSSTWDRVHTRAFL
jgi:hypothetical protein